MAIKYSEVADRNWLIYAEVLYHLIRIFHIIALTLIRNYTCVESLSLEFQESYSKRILWLKLELLVVTKFHIDTARNLTVKI